MGIFDPQGLSSSPSSQSITNSGISAWAQPYVFNYLNQGNALLNQGPTAFQQSVWDQAAGMQTPGQFAQGSNLLNQAGQGQLGTVNQALGYGAQGAGYGQQAAGAGANYQNMATNPNAIAAYMNPYIQQALAPQLKLLNQQQALAGQDIAAKAVGQGAFGGNRATLAQGLNAQNYDLARQQAIGQGYNEAFRQAQQAQQFGANLGLQGLQTGIQGAGMGLQGVQGAQQGYTGATQAGVGLGNIGAQQNQADVARLGLQSQLANQQYNLPFQRLNFMQGLMSGLPVSSSTTQGYVAGQNPWLQGIGAAGTLAQYAPSIWNTGKDIWNFVKPGSSGIPIGGDARDIGLTETALSSASAADLPYDVIASGGQITNSGVKRYAEGGIASINRKVLNNPTSYSEQTINRGAQDNILGGVTKLLALDTIAKQRAALQAQQAMQAQPKPPVAQQLAQQAMMGIDNAESNLPQQYAGGGIIAFEEGGNVPFPEKIQDLPAYLRSKVPGMDRFLNAFNLENIREQINQGTNNPVPVTAPAAETPAAPAKPASDITIGPRATNAAPAAGIGGGAPSVPMQPSRIDRGSGIDALTKRYEDMIRGGEDFKDSEKKAETAATREFFLRLMNPERGASFVSGLGAAGLESQKGLEKAQEALQARKDKQIGQLVALGLKGQDLKNELDKLGITEEYYRAHYPLLAAQASYYASGRGRGGSAGLGSIPFGEFRKLQNEYEGYYLNPQSILASPFARYLDKDTKDALKTKPGSPSYERGMQKAREVGEAHKRAIMQEGMQYSSKQRVASPLEDF